LVLESVANNVTQTLVGLNNYNTPHCDESSLQNMRRHVFLSDYIKDIGFVLDDGELACSTGPSFLNTADMSERPDYSDNLDGLKVEV
jgi:sensor c-di-GMP phosphodiesterase-like protein